jgi:TonB family protein
MAAPVRSGDDKPSRWGYLAAILASALGHAVFFVLVLVILPGFFSSKPPLPAYTVKIVDSIPAGDLGTHLPRLGQENPQPTPKQEARNETPKEKPEPAPSVPPPDNDKNAIALNTLHQTPTPTPMPTPTPTPMPTPTPPPPEPTTTPTPHPKKREHRQVRTPTPTPAPKRTEHHKPKAAPTPQLAKATPKPQVAKPAPTPNVKTELAKLREQLLAEHLKELRKEAGKNAAKSSTEAGPVLASKETSGKGYGVGPGSGSAGIQQDAEFLLYYQEVQKKIKEAWSFAGTNPDLMATVTFGINPDGTLNAIKVITSSRDPAFDDSVVRAIRRAAPFAAPPQKYREQFAQGVEAEFKLGELSS